MTTGLGPLMWAGLFMVVGILILVYLGRDTARLKNAPLGEIDLQGLIASEGTLDRSRFQDKVVVLCFWGTWSPQCLEAFPEYIKLYQEYKSKADIEFVSVSCSPGVENDIPKLREETQTYLDSLGIASMPTYTDPAMFTRSRIALMLSAGGFSYPMTMVVDKSGIVNDFWIGFEPTTRQEIQQAIDRCLMQK